MIEVNEINQRVHDVWNANAAWWDAEVGETDFSHEYVINPAMETLLAIKPGERVLDVACGNGTFARRLARLGGSVLAFDFSEELLKCAKARTISSPGSIEYKLIDATDAAQLASLGERCFDAAVVSMALMDMANIEPLMHALSRLLVSKGRLVFSITHPCFNSLGGTHTQWLGTEGVLVKDYIQPATGNEIAKPGQPIRHPFFHRPLWHLFGICFQVGFVLDGLLEPVPPEWLQTAQPEKWKRYARIPHIMVTRWRLLGQFSG
ncbi:methyltransferase domain-containing protein [Chlorogloeopsis sp. ULAP01]|jgi:ubiquinone/menaquinone biosynthesis C-methylase UbiE|uniref:class I SAM-dependent methyltransferase n=1 Tax=Chlorogloeopsis sp. ULAP01 TaxID=3056483 RepID=UPI0025AA9C78|nr:methyltransferase domain-containing protein [Chlorogloeopsis sp. ULAP01]MDM9384681.1 methyltransferase domain-containing protein [Chlorogloeopsis sp. ULAP01]